MQQAGAGPAISLRLGQALQAGSPGRAADLLAALLAPGRVARLAMLDAADEEGRLRIALDIVNVRVAIMMCCSALEVGSKVCCPQWQRLFAVSGAG